MNHVPTTALGLALMSGLGCVPAPFDGGGDGIDVVTSAATGPDDGDLSAAGTVALEGASPMDLREVVSPSFANSSVTASDGSRFVVGVFSGWFRAGDVVLRSHGADDVFLMHLLRSGRVDWARAIGSEREESAPRIGLDDGRIRLVAMTNGAVDCGGGALRSFDAETFFVCTFDERGTPLNGAAFPTGRP